MNFASDVWMPFASVSSMAYLWVVAGWCITAIIHVSFAVAVLGDSRQMVEKQHRGTFLVGGGIWALATLFGGVVVVAVYWAVHHSTLRPPPVVEER